MKMLGLSCYFHDAAAALIVDGTVVAAAEEERFTRVKHDSRFPERAIAFCLEHAGIAAADLDAVVFYEKPLTKFERMVTTARRHTPESWPEFSTRLIRQRHEGADLENQLRTGIGYEGPVWYTEHHVAHAASAFFCSPFEKAAVVTIDGVGEWATTTIGLGEGASYGVLAELHYPVSLGLFYSAMTAYLGFEVNSDEYKVMGLASYGRPAFVNELDHVLRVTAQDEIVMDMDFFTYQSSTTGMFSSKLEALLGPAHEPGVPATQRQMDIAASVQAKLEQAVAALLRTAYLKTGVTNLCLAGGVALNGVANWRCFQSSPFTNIFIPPAAGDSGGAIGAALYAYYATTGTRTVGDPFSPYLGPAFDTAAVKSAILTAGLPYRQLPEDELLAEVAAHIKNDQIVGWFQGRMEIGQRALGARSILANATNGEMKDIINSCVKFREEFRPFAPAVAAERAQEFFALDGQESPYMTMVPYAQPGASDQVPAVVHVDNTGRVQTVSADLNPRFHALLTHVEREVGVPVVLNTSFNVKGEPIVCTPTDAIRCFLNTDIDILALDNFIVSKEA